MKEIIIIYIISLADCEHPLGTWASCLRKEMFDLSAPIRVALHDCGACRVCCAAVRHRGRGRPRPPWVLAMRLCSSGLPVRADLQSARMEYKDL